ncbi:MAG: DUF6567 family protein [Verrucomicrobiota bacterium]
MTGKFWQPATANNQQEQTGIQMKRKILSIAACSVFMAILTGCANVGEIKGGHTDTSVTLAGKNYKVVQAGVIGHSSGFRLLGLIPIVSPNYANAKASLYKSIKEPITGRAVALANETEDRSLLYLILFSIPRVTITADVIEFTDAPMGEHATPK